MAYKQVAPLPVNEGGTGNISFNPNTVICGGTSSTSAWQTASTNVAGAVLVSNGSGALPSFQTLPIPTMNWQHLSADPMSPAEGQVWYNTTTDLFKGYDGTSVVTFVTVP